MPALQVATKTPELCRVPNYDFWVSTFCFITDFVVVYKLRELVLSFLAGSLI
jgi:hypothetical protein